MEKLYRNKRGKYHVTADDYLKTGRGRCGADISRAAYQLPLRVATVRYDRDYRSKLCKECLEKS